MQPPGNVSIPIETTGESKVLQREMGDGIVNGAKTITSYRPNLDAREIVPFPLSFSAGRN